MDPFSLSISIATTIQIVAGTSSKLCTFIKESRNVDQNVRNLEAEVNGLKQTLSEVDSILKQPNIAAADEHVPTNDSKQLQNTLKGCLEECKKTVGRLDSSLIEIHNRYSKWTMQALRQVKLNLRKDEINLLRTQIHTHCLTLSTALQLVNMRATYLVPGVVIGDLGPRIANLQRSLNLMMESMQDLKGDASNTQKLHSLGTRILAKASTIYGSSVGNESVCGDQISNDTVHRTMSWIPEPMLHNRTLSMSSTTLSSGNQPTSSIADSSIDTAVTQPDTIPTGTDDIDSDSEAEFEFEIAQGLLDRGEAAFRSANYREAVGFLQKGIAAFNRLPYSLRSQLDPVEVPLMIATCKYYLNEIDEASHDLITLVRRESCSDKDAIRKCQISYLLSQICFIKNDLEAAEDHCRNSLKGRRRLLGKNHPDYFESLSLLSEICLVNGKKEEAAVYKDRLPLDFHQNVEVMRLRNLMDSRKFPQELDESPRAAQSDSHDHPVGQAIQRTAIQPAQTCGLRKLGEIDSFSPSTVSSSRSLASIQVAQNRNGRIMFDKDHLSLHGHTEEVCGVTFSPNGSLLASASRDMTVRLWEPRTGREVQELKGHSNFVSEVAFSLDSSLLASASHDQTVRIWDSSTGRQRYKLKGHKNHVLGVAFSPNDWLLASASRDETIRIWDPKTGQEKQKLKGHASWVLGVAFSPNDSILASVSSDKTVRRWDLKSGREVQKLERHANPGHGVAFSANGLLLATSEGKTVSIWDLKNSQEVKFEGHTRSVNKIAFLPDASILASASSDKTVRIWDLGTSQEIQKLEGHTKWVQGVAFSPGGSHLASASTDYTVRIWKARRDKDL